MKHNRITICIDCSDEHLAWALGQIRHFAEDLMATTEANNDPHWNLDVAEDSVETED
jgi:hypothetical protein